MTALLMAAAQNQPVGEKTDAMAAMPEMRSSDEDEVKPDKTAKRPKDGGPAKSATVQPAAARLPNTVGFPYGFPTAGAYRIFVQMKRGATIETAAFDACAGEPSAN